MPIERYMPAYHVREFHATAVAAPAEQVYGAIHRADLFDSPVTQTLFWLRGLPARLTARRSVGRTPTTVASMLRGGFVLLADDAPHELAMGLVGSFWSRAGNVRLADAAAFYAFDQPGYARAAINFLVVPQGPDRALLSTETRVLCLDEESRRKFSRYWGLIAPFSGWIRRIALASIRRTAEAPRGLASERGAQRE